MLPAFLSPFFIPDLPVSPQLPWLLTLPAQLAHFRAADSQPLSRHQHGHARPATAAAACLDLSSQPLSRHQHDHARPATAAAACLDLSSQPSTASSLCFCSLHFPPSSALSPFNLSSMIYVPYATFLEVTQRITKHILTFPPCTWRPGPLLHLESER